MQFPPLENAKATRQVHPRCTKNMRIIITVLALLALGARLPAQVAFNLASSPGVGPNPNSGIAADVNADGKPDLISANANAGTVSVLTNDGHGGFVPAATLTVGAGPLSVAAADLNGDGLLELLTANSTANTVSMLTNLGGAGFSAQRTYGVGGNPWSVIAADLSGNGRLDVISANGNGNSLTVLRSSGSDGVVTATAYAVGSNPHSVIAADVNGDGKLDLISANTGGNTLSVLTNNGRGGFVLASSPVVGTGPFCVTSGDVNRDGRLDLISVNYNSGTISVLINNANNGFLATTNYVSGSQPRSIVAVDVNGDGAVDLVAANSAGDTLPVLLNNGIGGFSLVTSPSVGSGPQSLAATDLNLDGKVDLVTANQENTLSIMTNGTPFPPPYRPSIAIQPVGQTNLVGAPAALSVVATAATGPLLFNYQWRLAGTNLPAATNSALSLPKLALNQLGHYDVVITNIFGSVTSSPALLDVRFVLVKVNGQPATSTMTSPMPATVTLAGGYPSGYLFYTLDGTAPTVNSTYYAGPISLTTSAVVQGMNLSADFSQTTLSAPVTVLLSYPVTVSTPGGGSVAVDGQPGSPATNYLTGTVVTLTATASNGWSFVRWQGDASGTNNPLAVTMDQTRNIQAIFGTVVTTTTLGGSVVLNQANPVPYGAVLTVSAVPNSGYYFLTWGGAASGNVSPTTITVTNSTPNVSALFGTLPAGKYSLSVVVNGSGSVTNYPQRSYYSPGDGVILTAMTNGGAYFLGWSQDASDTNNPLGVVMSTNKVVQANFGVLPTVSISPPNLTVLAGSNAVFTATAYGTPPLTYQWQKNQANIVAATNVLLTLTNCQPASAGAYFAVVSNPAGSIASAAATLTVVSLPAITNQPAPLTVAVSGHPATFSVAATGWPAPAYQWQFNGVKLAGATNSRLTLPHVFATNAGLYAVVITNIYGRVTSDPSQLTVLPLLLTAPKLMAGGQFQFGFDTASGLDYSVEYSTDLTHWFPLVTLGGIGLPLTLIDPNTAGSPERFYRILLQQP